MIRPLSDYETIAFDCDGVVLNSNKIKSQAFFDAAAPYGEEAAQELYNYHIARGGISRYAKFEYFLEKIVPGKEGPSFEELLDRYAAYSFKGLMSCEIAGGLEELRKQTSNSRWMIVSGGDQNELRQVFEKRGLDHFFDAGIFGSPTTKDEILDRESTKAGDSFHPSLFLGDSRYDHVAARRQGMDFIFVSKWTEFSDFVAYTAELEIPVIEQLSDLLN